MPEPGDGIAALRTELAALHRMLVDSGLVVWTAGNVSARAGDDAFLIKPSGVPYEHLTPDSMVLCDLEGKPADGEQLKPSSDRSPTPTCTGTARRRRSGAHPLDLRDRVGGPR